MTIEELIERWRREFDRPNRRAEFDESDLREFLELARRNDCNGTVVHDLFTLCPVHDR